MHEGRPRESRAAGQATTGNPADSGGQQSRGSSRMPPLQQAREIIASLRLEGTRFSIDGELLERLERTRGLKVALETRKLSAGQGFTGAAVQIGEALVIVCPEGADALKDPIIAHEVAHVVRGDPGIDFEAVAKALNDSPDLPFVICDPETELQAECTSAAIVVLARRPDSPFRRALSRIGTILFGRVPGSAEKWRDTAETHTRYFDVDR